MEESIETSYQAAIATRKINGAVLCATGAEGKFVYNNAIGQRTQLSGEKTPQQLDDVLCLALATGLITTIAVLQCVEDGLLDLTGDMSSILPELTAKQVLTGYSGQTPHLETASGRPVTLETLLTHSSGHGYYFLDRNLSRWRSSCAAAATEDGVGERKPVEELYSYPLSFKPGSGWMYGPGLDWAGRAVERVTGCTLGARMEQRIFAPLGITDAQFFPATRRVDLRGRLVDLNPEDPECLGSAVLGGGGEMNKRTQGDFGGHGLFMSGTSFLKVLNSLLANDGQLLRPTTVDDMFADHLGPEAAAGFQKVLSGELGTFFRADSDIDTKCGYGFGGLLILEDIKGLYGEGTLSWGGGLTNVWFIDRKNNLCGFGAVHPSLPIHGSGNILALKTTFCQDIYRKYAEWKQHHTT